MFGYITQATRAAFGVFVMAALAVGCGTSGTGGDGGNGGTSGTGGTNGGGVEVLVPQCVSSAYQVVFRAFVQPLDPLLRYIDTPVEGAVPGLPPAEARSPDQLPPIGDLVELKDVTGVYSRFTWTASEVPGVEDLNDTVIQADFVESSGLNPADLDNGISNMEVMLLPWTMFVEERVVGEGKLSVAGLGEDTVRITIVDFNPQYENLCEFEIFNFGLQLDLATPGSQPFAVQIGYTADGPGYGIDSGWITLGEGESASFTGDFAFTGAAAIPFDFTLDYSTDPAGMSGTFGGVPADCTIDLETFAVVC